MQQFFSTLFADDKLKVLAFIVGALVAALVLIALYRLLFGPRIRGGVGGRRQPRLGVVDAYDLDRQRQLVLVRRDNVEHLIMIGGPNDMLIESAIVRAQAVGQSPGMTDRREPGMMNIAPADEAGDNPPPVAVAPAAPYFAPAPVPVSIAPPPVELPKPEPIRAPDVVVAPSMSEPAAPPAPAVTEPPPAVSPVAPPVRTRMTPIPTPPRLTPRPIPPIPKPFPKPATPRPVTTPVAADVANSIRSDPKVEPSLPAAEPKAAAEPSFEPAAPIAAVEPVATPRAEPAPPPEASVSLPAEPPRNETTVEPASEPKPEFAFEPKAEAEPGPKPEPVDPLEALEQEMARLLNRPPANKP